MSAAAAIATVLVLVIYEASLAIARWRRPERMARTAHASLREDWSAAVSATTGSEILAVLGLMGTVSLAAPSLHASIADAGAPGCTPRLAMALLLLGLLFASLVSSAMAVRYYHHASFVGGMPQETQARQRWALTGTTSVRKAGALYSWGLRQLVLVAATRIDD